MYTVFLAGGIASGKSTVARELERHGAWRIDLDQVSRSVLEPSSACLDEVVAAFGEDLLDPQTGELDRTKLARRAFVNAATTAQLESIELPYIKATLVRALRGNVCAAMDPAVCVVEIPLLDRVESLFDLADEIVVVICPYEIRRLRAQKRGMDVEDFERRCAAQPGEAYLRSHATTIFENSGSEQDLLHAIAVWWKSHDWI